MRSFSVILRLILLASIIAVASSATPLPVPADGCVGKILAMSPCLEYISSFPNNISASASSKCCDSFSSEFYSGEGLCFCYLLRQHPILGFPLNQTRILSLSSVCPPINSTSSRNASLETLCLGSAALPPLRSTPVCDGPSPSGSSGSPYMTIPPPGSAESLPAPLPGSAETPSNAMKGSEGGSSGRKKNGCNNTRSIWLLFRNFIVVCGISCCALETDSGRTEQIEEIVEKIA